MTEKERALLLLVAQMLLDQRQHELTKVRIGFEDDTDYVALREGIHEVEKPPVRVVWQTEITAEDKVPCHKLVVDGVLCQWWGVEEPEGAKLLTRLLERAR